MASTTAENAPEEVIVTAIETKANEPKAAKKAKAPKENKPKAPKGSKPALAHPPYFQMIKEVISALKEKGVSSPKVIAKYMEEKHKAVLPLNYKKMLIVQIKKIILTSELTKVKVSFKLVEGVKKVPAEKIVKLATKTASKPKTAPKSTKPASKPKTSKKVAKAPVASKTRGFFGESGS